MLVSRSQARLVYFLPAIFISLFACCSVSIYPRWGLRLGRSDHFQQQAPRIRATCHIVPVTTNDYQCIRAECQCAGQGTAGRGDGGGGAEGTIEVGAARSKEREVQHTCGGIKTSHHIPSVNKVPYISSAERVNQSALRGWVILHVWWPAETGVRV